MKATLDTNVLASGFLGFERDTNRPGAVLRAWRAGRFELVIAEHILGELARTFGKPYFRLRFPPGDALAADALLRRRATLVAVTAPVHDIATHPEDDVVLATAISAGADYLVTGDRQLRLLGSVDGVVIVEPREFLDILGREPSDD